MPARPFKFPRHGVLNPIEHPITQDRIDIENFNVSDFLGDVAKKVYISDALANTGPYKAIVLRIEDSSISPDLWTANYYDSILNRDETKPRLLKIKARIPEIYSHLPIPASLGPDSEESGLIDMYPTFLAADDQVPAPEIGSIVWVDFSNKTNFSVPIYLGPVISKSTVGAVGNVSPVAKHAFVCSENRIQQPAGDALAGRNKPLSHSGLPLQKRDTFKKISKEIKIIKSGCTSKSVHNRWKKILEREKIYSTTWIGDLPSNGSEDLKHPLSKRDTIIFSPNQTDFSSPIELMYYFHSLNEFGDKYEFEQRYTGFIRELLEQKRNFVLVIPELPWSAARGSVDPAWQGDDNFSSFHKEVLGQIKTSFSKSVDVGFISITAFGMGGSAIKTAVRQLRQVMPNKITFADADYDDSLQSVWNLYVKTRPEVELNILTGTNVVNRKKTQRFLKTLNAKERQRVLVKEFSSNHRLIGNASLGFINETKEREKDKEVIAGLKNAPAADSEELQEQEPPGLDIETVQSQRGAEVTVIHQPEPKYPAGPNADISPSSTPKKKGKSFKLTKGRRFEENRVRVKDYGTLTADSPQIAQIPKEIRAYGPSPKTMLHVLAIKRLLLMNAAWLKENPGEKPLTVISGLRKDKFKGDRDAYEEFLKKNNTNSKLIAYESPHQTGLAFDFGIGTKNNHVLWPNSATNARQKRTKVYKWLVNNAHLFGISPYKYEAWHWSLKLPKESWLTGTEFTEDLSVRVTDIGDFNTPKSKEYLAKKGCVRTLGDFGV